ncbi:MAG: phage Gp37/Gp68 family protein [Enhydrobacter sp.]|nr:phage Gp37/Gp68 family protein [Enhydrobacter sp.]
MAEQTKIEWVDHTFNPWIGCTKVSPACDNCYAAAMSHRRRWARFQARAPRRRTSAGNWLLPLRWNRKAEAAGIRAKVFGPSLADPFDAEVSPDWREDYLRLIEATPSLDWILLTKRPLVARKFFADRKVPDNLWPGITAENQAMLDLRAPHLLATDAKVRVVSAEPLLGPLDLSRWSGDLGWVIAGGESGPRARPSDPDWFRSLRGQCAAAGIPLFFKQWGEHGQDRIKVGRRKAGAMLDGREHRDAPVQSAGITSFENSSTERFDSSKDKSPNASLQRQ